MNVQNKKILDRENIEIEIINDFKDFSDIPFGILDFEIQALVFYIFKKIISKYDHIDKKEILNELFEIIINNQYTNINKLFNLTKFNIKNFFSLRIKYYEKIFDESNKKSNTLLEKFKDKIIYSSSYIFYILKADENYFKKNALPFANKEEINKSTVQLRNENHKKYDDLDKFYTDNYNILEKLYKKALNKVNEVSEMYKKNNINESTNNYEDEIDLTNIIIISLIILFVIILPCILHYL